MTDTIHVFVCYTPFHVMVSEWIRAAEGLEEANLVALDAAAGFTEGGWDDVWVRRSATTGPRQWNRARTAAAARAHIKRLIGARPCMIYFAHLDEYLSNSLCFFPPHERVSFWRIPDGSLSVYDPGASVTGLLKRVGKSFTAAIAGIPFRPYLGSVKGDRVSRIEGQFSFPGVIPVDALESRSISAPDVVIETQHRRCIVLGQESIIPSVGKSRYRKQLERIHAWIGANLADATVIYKPHHLGRDLMGPDDLPRNWQVDRSTVPAELAVARAGATALIGSISSALLNVQLLYGGRVRVVSIDFDETVRESGIANSFAAFGAVMQSAGVHMVGSHS